MSARSPHLDEIVAERPYAVAHARSVPRNRPLSVRRFGKRLVLFRDREGAIVAGEAACPHRGADLGHGKVERGEIVCPYHGFRFGADGACSRVPCQEERAAIPKTLRLRTLPVRERGGFVWMRPDGGPVDGDAIAWPADLGEDAWHHARAEMRWSARMSRAVEAMLDFHHVPFAHERVMGGFDRFLEQRVTVDGERIELEAALAHRRLGLRFAGKVRIDFPATVTLTLGERWRGAVVLAPIDDESTWIGVRYFHVRPRLSLLAKIGAWLGLKAELRLIQADDERMIAGTEPRSGHLGASVLVGADRAIAEWYLLRGRILERHAPPEAKPEPEGDQAPRRLSVLAGAPSSRA